MQELRELLEVDTRTPAEVQAERARLKAVRAQAEYDEQIRERDERMRNSPEVQAGYARERVRVEQERKQQFEDFVARSRLSVRDETNARFSAYPHDYPQRCMDCGESTFLTRMPINAFQMCDPCYSTHRITCDDCGKRNLTDYFPIDSGFRCQECAGVFQVEYPKNPKPSRGSEVSHCR